MKSLLVVSAILFSVNVQAGDVLIVDLNNSSREVAACQAGVAAANPQDRVEVFGKGQVISQDGLEKFIAAREAQGRSFDTIIISGHDGSGHFFGTNGDLNASELTNIVEHRPKLKASLTGMALWGCYDANANACENYWMKNISPNIKSALGFTLQSPDNTRPGNWDLLQDYCMKRKAIEDAQTEAEYNQIFFGLKGIKSWNAGICTQQGICSTDYGKTGEKSRTCYHSYEELNARCKDFDPGRKKLAMYQSYLEAKTDRYANPPPDGENEFTATGVDPTTTQEKGEIRKYYNQLHLWYHCSGDLLRQTGYVMPMPSQVIRLTKFEMLKRNFENLQGPELADYNKRLAAMGLGELALRPSSMSRKEIVQRTEAAVIRLQEMTDAGNRKVNGIDPYKMLIMAYGFDNSLRTLQPQCTPFSYVHEAASRHSDCVTIYGDYPKWPSR